MDHSIGQRLSDEWGGRYFIVDKIDGVWMLLSVRPSMYAPIDVVPMDPNVNYTIITD